MAKWEVIVGNVGMVYSGTDEELAHSTYDVYVEHSRDNYGRAAGESVYLFKDDQDMDMYLGTLDNELNEAE